MNHFRYLCQHGISLHAPCHDCERSMNIRNESHDHEESLRLQSPTYQEAMERHNSRMARDHFCEIGPIERSGERPTLNFFYPSILASHDRALRERPEHLGPVTQT